MAGGTLLDAVTTNTTGASRTVLPNLGSNYSVLATVSGTGSVSVTVTIEVTNGTGGWVTLGTISLSGTTSATDGFAFAAPYNAIRATTSDITGTGASVTCIFNG